MVQGQIDIGQCLGLHTLHGVDHQQDSFTSGQTTGNFVSEVDVTWRIDQIEFIQFAVFGPMVDTNSRHFYGDPALPFQIHAIQDLLAHSAGFHCTSHFQEAVGKGGFPMVNMSDDAEVPDVGLIHWGVLGLIGGV